MLQYDPSLLTDFATEVRGLLPELRAALDHAATGADPAEALEPAYRHAHNIAGTAALLGLDDLSALAGRLENELEAVRENAAPLTPEALAAFARAAERIEQAIGQLAAAEAGPTREAPPVAPEPPPDLAEEAAPPPVAPTAQPESPPVEPDADEDSEPVSPELLEVFVLEAQDHLGTIHRLLTTLRDQPGNKRVLLEIRRAAHTLKGAASVVGFRAVTRLAHRMEDMLDWFAEGSDALSAELVDLLVQSADGLEDLTSEKPNRAAVRELYRRYDQVMADLHAHRPPAGDDEAEAPAEAAPRATPADEPEPEPEPEGVALPRAAEQMVRVPLERLDSLVKLVGELIMSRTVYEQRASDFQRLVSELRLSADRLRRSSGKLDAEYEARALAAGSTAGSGLGHLATFQTHGFDELEFDRYTDFHLVTRELAETTIDLQTVGHELGNLHDEFEGFLTRQSRLTSEVQDKLMRIRMVPLATLASRLHRTVRTTARQVGKSVELVLEGEGTELDKTVLEEMADPLLHLLRNAVDHGIEPAEARRQRGKPAQGTIRVRASTEGTQVVLRIQDDGGGFDAERVRAQAVARGLATAAEVAGLADADLHAFLFAPGFSTAAEVSEISGRGVGLDIVRAQVNKLKGTIDATSDPGRGATFTIRLPLMLAVLRTLLVRANRRVFALPLTCIDQILRTDVAADQVGQEKVLRVGKKIYPLVSLAERLNLKGSESAIERPPVVLLRAGDQELALVVDELLGGREIVLKNLGHHLRKVHGFSGAALQGDGSVVLVIDPNELFRDPARGGATPNDPLPIQGPRSRQAVNALVVDDSPSVRRVVSDLLRNAGMVPTVAKDGLDALEVLHRSNPLPDVVLTDIEMPRMDGYELISTLRVDPRLRDIPVIVITSRAGDRHRRKAMELGATAYLVKPYPEEALLRTVRDLVQQAAGARG